MTMSSLCVPGIILFLSSSCFVLCMVNAVVSLAMCSFALINWNKLMCRSYPYWLLPLDSVMLLVLMSMSCRPITCPTQGSTPCLSEYNQVHPASGHRLLRTQRTRYQPYSSSFVFSSVCGMTLYFFIHLLHASYVFPHYSWLLYFTNLISQGLENLHASVKISRIT
jgi:hypothetical protein